MHQRQCVGPVLAPYGLSAILMNAGAKEAREVKQMLVAVQEPELHTAAREGSHEQVSIPNPLT